MLCVCAVFVSFVVCCLLCCMLMCDCFCFVFERLFRKCGVDMCCDMFVHKCLGCEMLRFDMVGFEMRAFRNVWFLKCSVSKCCV